MPIEKKENSKVQKATSKARQAQKQDSSQHVQHCSKMSLCSSAILHQSVALTTFQHKQHISQISTISTVKT